MCGQFYMDDDSLEDVMQIVKEIDHKLYGKQMGDIHPSDSALIITGRDKTLRAEQMNWGFSSTVNQKHQLLINARSETALQKALFSESVLRRRCVIPAKHFYEWDAERNKVTFSLEKEPALYMAGFYNRSGGEDRFIILTTAANESMKRVHDRMPLILPKEEIEEWIMDDGHVERYLSTGSPMLVGRQKYEQLKLF